MENLQSASKSTNNTQAVTEKTGSDKPGTDASTDVRNNAPTIEVPINPGPPILDATMTSIFIGNLTTEATEDDLRQLFGLDTTKYLRNNVRINIIFNSKGKYKTYAIIDCPKHIFDELLKLNGEMTLDNRTLIIEPVCAKNIITPYKRKERSQGIHRQNQFPTPSTGVNQDLHPTLPLGKGEACLPPTGWKANLGKQTGRR